MNALAVVHSRALLGLSAPSVSVEVHLANGLPAFNIVGLPETSVRESRERVRAALLQSGLDFPNRRITVNLAPADLPKESGRFDLPIAIGIAAAAGALPIEALRDIELVGELSLSGELRPIRAALAVASGIRAHAPGRGLILPLANLPEARPSELGSLHGAATLAEVIRYLRGEGQLTSAHDLPEAHPAPEASEDSLPDLSDVMGQLVARRALEISAAGMHPLLMSGSPGTGKSMLAQRLPGLLPPLSHTDALESATIHAASGQTGSLRTTPAYRAPHHSITAAALMGGGSPPRPGEISLAHAGVLFLDELPEFRRHVIECLREPLETGHVTLSRGVFSETFPARFLLVAAMNPCPCGSLGDPARQCRCTPAQIRRYQAKLSGPLLERFDLGIEMVREPSLTPSRTQQDACATAGTRPESSVVVAQRVLEARHRQTGRQGCCNAHLPVSRFDECLHVAPEATLLLRQAAEHFGWSLRSQHKTLRVARTIADLAGSTIISPNHLAEAVALRRPLDHLASDHANDGMMAWQDASSTKETRHAV
ncbi:MAG: YifB family Mg chelatase-like AAA ATPase [Lautropia sp.]|nr:YifB family Mg chelatase-like AAA ATPase [Lautropia sp.]